MTDPLAPLSDEDLSALLDGQADPSVLDRLARDPAARARRDALAAAAAAIAGPVAPLGADQVDDLVARALAAAPVFELADTGEDAAADEPGADAEVLTLPPRPSRSLPPRWLVAAAVVVLVAIGLALVWSGRDDTTEDQASTSAKQSETAADEDSSGGLAMESGTDDNADAPAANAEPSATPDDGEATETTVAAGDEAPEIPRIADYLGAPIYLGSFATPEELRPVVATAFPTASEPLGDVELPEDASFQRCAEQMRVTLSIEDPATAYGYALVDDVPSMAFQYDGDTFAGGKPATVVTAVRADTCEPYFTIQR